VFALRHAATLAHAGRSRKLSGELRPRLLLAWLVTAACAAAGCSGAPRQPPGVPPTPRSITREEPGGDAFDPHRAALDRLVKQPWGWRSDKRDALHFPLTDWKNWRRVRFFGVPTFVGFRYGDRHRAVAAMRVTPVRDGDPPTPAMCMQRAFEWGEPIADGSSTKLGAYVDRLTTWRSRDDMLIRTMQADIKTLLARKRYYAVVGSMLPWPGVCATYGYAFEADDADDMALRARDRYAAEAFQQLARIAETPPSD
jgi:hypothetical protein